MTPSQFVEWLYPSACAAARKTGISPVFITAQAALESGWGKSRIGEWNLFGITRGSWTGPCILVETTEYFTRPDVRLRAPEEVLAVERTADGRYRCRVRRLFRDYPSLADALADHAAVLAQPCYADAWPYRGDPDRFVERLQDSAGARYATSPDYVATMRRLFRTVERIIAEKGLQPAA